MLVGHDNRLGLSTSPHSLSNVNSLTVPGWGDNNYFIKNQKAWNGAGFQGIPGMGSGVGKCASSGCTGKCCGGGMNGLSFDGTGFLGTGLFSGDISSWGFGEIIFGLIGAYAIYSMFFQAKQTKYRMEMGAGRRRKRRAASMRVKAKQLEEQTTGIF